jgi:dihydroorotate dehydrogenase (NAD+) catalytic subunit
MKQDISINLFNKRLLTPLIPASGVYGYGEEYDFIDTLALGAFCTKGLSIKPKDGNPVPRIAEVSDGVINSVGLQNKGIDKFIEEEYPKIKKLKQNVIVNFFGNTKEEYIEASKKLDSLEDIFALEMNVSCPNVKEGGIGFGQDEKDLEDLTREVKKNIKKPLIVKLTPNVTDITKIALAAKRGGADAVSLINTVKAMKIDINSGKPILANKIGGLSGPAIKPIAIRCVYEVAKKVKIPIIGMGGITKGSDVIEFLMAGATCVQVGAGLFNNPNILSKIRNEIIDYLKEKKLEKLESIIGKAL